MPRCLTDVERLGIDWGAANENFEETSHLKLRLIVEKVFYQLLPLWINMKLPGKCLNRCNHNCIWKLSLEAVRNLNTVKKEWKQCKTVIIADYACIMQNRNVVIAAIKLSVKTDLLLPSCKWNEKCRRNMWMNTLREILFLCW